MRIGIEGQRLFRTRKHGMDMVALELINNLQKIDTSNEYFIFVKPDEDSECIKETPNFKIVELGGGPYPSWEQYALPRAARKYNCDLLHCTSNTAPVYSKIPIVVTLHDIIYLESISIFKKSGTWYQKFGNMYRRFVVPPVYKKAKKIITVSNFEKNRIANFMGDQSDRLVAIYNGVSEHFQPVNDENVLERVRKEYDLPEKFIFFLGNTDPKKNVIGVLKAFRKYIDETGSDEKLLMIDYPEDDLQRKLSEFESGDLRKHIHVLGYVVNTDLPAMYSLSEYFLYPSLRESFGIPMLEAMSCGAAVITSNTSSMPEVSGGAAEIVDPFKPDTIVEAMIKLKSDRTFKENLIRKGFDNAKKFSWESMAHDVLKLYESVCCK